MRQLVRGIAAVAAGGILLAGSAALAQGMALPGKLDVSDTGAATYSIPVVVPPGLAGATPSLSLEYNSQAGDGILGIGWSLAGIPAVTRCNRTWDQDGYVRDVRFDAQDAFCLSGQRLIALGGTYGADGTEYRTEIDGFSRIISYGTAGTGPQSFKVWTKAGLILEFGATADSRVPLNASSTTARAWALDRQEDQYGNSLTATYTPSAANGQAYLSRIDYSGNSAAGVTPANSVRFTYEARTDNAILYHAGYLTRTPQRLTTIDTYDGASLVSKYKLTYEYGPANNISRLTSVTLCEAAGTCLPATSFTWNTNKFGDGTKTLLASSTPWASDTTYGFADFNNDGIQDLWYNPSGTTTFMVRLGTYNGELGAATDWSGGNAGGTSRGIADLNGDGAADLWVRSSSSKLYVHLSNGTDHFGETIIWGDTGGLADFNGDGLLDRYTFSDNKFLVGLSNGSTFNAATTWYTLASAKTLYQVGDFDGDGLAELYYQSGGITTDSHGDVDGGTQKIYLTRNDGTSLKVVYSATYPYFYSYSQGDFAPQYEYTLVDLNGDGNVDFKMSNTYTTTDTHGDVSGEATSWSAKLYTGTGFGGTYNALGTVDRNGDGIADASCALTWANLASATATPCSAYNPTLYPIDLFGTGRPNAWSTASSDKRFWYYPNLAEPDNIIGISNGLGGTFEIDYSPLSAGGTLYKRTDEKAWIDKFGVYHARSDIHYPMQSGTPTLRVVKEVRRPDGIGGKYRLTYSYSNAISQLRGRGFLGFTSKKERDEQMGIELTTDYYQDYPLVGLPRHQDKDTKLNRVDSTYEAVASTDGFPRWTVRLKKTEEHSADINGTEVPGMTTTYDYDDWGNTTTVTTQTEDGYGKSVVNTYLPPDGTRWLLSRLSASTVTHTGPN